MQICTLASSSSGNCAIVSHEGTHILIDAGISMRRIMKSLAELDLKPNDLSGILITHEHSDHIGGIKMMSKHYEIPIYASEGVAEALCAMLPETAEQIAFFKAGYEFELGYITVRSFLTPHDTPESVGYRLHGGSHSISFVTDLGCVTKEIMHAVTGADLAVIEANHDIDLLKNGTYPYFLKKRILANRGHLSNVDSGKLARELITSGTKRVILAHLSRENNTPGLAYDTVSSALEDAGAFMGSDFHLHVAPASTMGTPYIV